jgi:predicted AlkP superfamily phosphohydrolase/phosphomutase
MIHLGGFDNVQHVFWQYRFPRDFARTPETKDVEALGSIIDRYAEFVDRGVGEMMGAFAEQPNAMIISDHGMGSFENKPPFKGWHASPGIFVAAGPDFPHRKARMDVSYYDIVPTILDLKGLEKPETLKGKSLATLPAALAR